MPALIRKETTETKIQEMTVSLQEVLEDYHCDECPLDNYCNKALDSLLGTVCGELNLN